MIGSDRRGKPHRSETGPRSTRDRHNVTPRPIPTPLQVAPSERVLALHLEDSLDETTETAPGNGRLDVPESLALLDEEAPLPQPLVVEYEVSSENPTPAVVEAIETIKRGRDDSLQTQADIVYPS